MADIGIFYGSDTGHTEEVAQMLQELFSTAKADLFDVRKVSDISILNNYKLLIFGTPTWYLGELQGDMEDFKDKIASMDFAGRTIALFGLGDQIEYSDYYLDAMGMLYHFFAEKNAKIVGFWPTEGYNFSSVLALGDNIDKFVGLALDADNQPDETPTRVATWCEQLHNETGI
jgi:flavodoxin long chain